MAIQLLNGGLLSALHEEAQINERLSQNYDLRTTPKDGSQRMLNVLQPGTKVAVHRREELPNFDAGGPIHDGETAADESQFKEVARLRICPREGQFVIQIPKGAWHSIEVLEASAIFEAKDGGDGT